MSFCAYDSLPQLFGFACLVGRNWHGLAYSHLSPLRSSRAAQQSGSGWCLGGQGHEVGAAQFGARAEQVEYQRGGRPPRYAEKRMASTLAAPTLVSSMKALDSILISRIC